MIFSPEQCDCPLEEYGTSLANSTNCGGNMLFLIFLENFLRGRCDIARPCERIKSIDEVQSDYDFIVVGGGTAGSIVAGRLSENSKYNILLLEAGDEEPIGAKPPSFYRNFYFNQDIDWRYRTEPAEYCLDQGKKGCMWPRGKVLGGSSVLNGMAYHRGHKADYEDWVEAGAKGWSYEDNKPFFDMTEGNKQIGTIVNQENHSDKGPLPVQRFRYQPPFVKDLLKALNESGFPIIDDMNNPDTPNGFTIAQTFNDNGQRVTTAQAFLKPNKDRKNLHVKLKAHVTKVLFEEKKAFGVEFINKNGEKKTVNATKEVILSAGALNSPQLLMLSGVGPPETLLKYNISQVASLPVGLNLRNHYGITLYFLLTKLENTQILDWKSLVEFLLQKNGPMAATGITQVTGFLYSNFTIPSKKQPDIQIFFNDFYAECSQTGVVGEPVDDCYKNGRNISTSTAILKPKSIGTVSLNSANPLDPPLMNPNYFSNPEDLIMIIEGVKNMKKIFDSDILQNTYGIKLNENFTSQCNKSGPEWSDPWVECMAREHTDPQNHQMGTAAIGQVVDTELKVYQVEGLRVIDASVMPTQVTGNPQGPIMMVAERGADFIKKKWS